MKKYILIAMILVFLAGIGAAAWQIYLPLREDSESIQAYTYLRKHVQRPTLSLELGHSDDESQEPMENQPVEDSPLAEENSPIDFAALREINTEIAAWLTIPGTAIDYPVAQHIDNDYYLHHLFTGEWNSSGCLFMDCRNRSDLTDRHTIIYGHHMANGTMFQNLVRYRSQEFYEQHPTAQIYTPEGSYAIEFFAGYVASVLDNAWTTGFDSDEEFARWLSVARGRSLFSSPVVPSTDDCIITLSTCSYDFYNARFVLLGRIAEG